ncbi:MAG: zinc ABC transporter substrate-binding protein [Desulfobacter sp.]|nr:zinc ABC transporter substrate-binding protein [Desulfobacter sp.]
MAAGSVAAADPLPVFVSILPQKYMVEQIGKDRVAVKVMVSPGASPATYEPKPVQMAKLAKTKIYFPIGVAFERAWLEKIAKTNPAMTIVHTDEGIDKIPMAEHGHGEEDHLHDKAHSHEDNFHQEDGLDPHIWLSPKRVMVQAGHILKGLVQADPGSKKIYTQNYTEFLKQTADLDQALSSLLLENKGMGFMVFHPAWGYFAHDYGLKMIPIEIEGKDPKPGQLKDLIQAARKKGIQIIFVQPQFSAKSATLVAREIQGQVVAADPLAYDWHQNMKNMAEKFKEALK